MAGATAGPMNRGREGSANEPTDKTAALAAAPLAGLNQRPPQPRLLRARRSAPADPLPRHDDIGLVRRYFPRPLPLQDLLL